MLINKGIIQKAMEISRDKWNEQPLEIRSVMVMGTLRDDILSMERLKLRLKRSYNKEIKDLNERILRLAKEILKEGEQNG